MKRSASRFSQRFTFILIVAAGALGYFLIRHARDAKAAERVPSVGLAATNSSIQFQHRDLSPARRAYRTTNVQILDFNKDGRNDILVCDAARNAVILNLQRADGSFEEQILADHIKVPAHATVVDLDNDGDLDIVVSVLGSIFPWDELVGKVILLENENGKFTQHVLLEDVRRVADVQPGDFNGDGKIDLAVAVFGYARGEILWMENLGKKAGEWHFTDHILLEKPGAIHVPVADYDGDGKLDIAAIVSQEEEELWIFKNEGNGKFAPQLIHATANYDIGSAGLVLCDLDKDGKPDLLVPEGDNLEDSYAWPQPYHGVAWYHNLGGLKFERKQIANLGGTYAAAVGDIDGDGDQDVVLASYVNDWNDPNRPSVVWLENDGNQNFKMRSVAASPIALVTVACGDLNGDGRADIVAGSLLLPPLVENRLEHLPVWLSIKQEKK